MVRGVATRRSTIDRPDNLPRTAPQRDRRPGPGLRRGLVLLAPAGAGAGRVRSARRADGHAGPPVPTNTPGPPPPTATPAPPTDTPVPPSPTPAPLSGHVTNAYDGSPVPGARVTAGDKEVSTDGNGMFVFATTDPNVTVRVIATGYATATATSTGDAPLDIALRPTNLSGRITTPTPARPSRA